MFLRLLNEWGGEGKPSPREITNKVKRFHFNRHKSTAGTPTYHEESYSQDDYRFDLHPFLYTPAFESWSFKKIDERLASLENARERKQAEVQTMFE